MAAYVGLTKPRVIELLLLTTVPVMFFAARGVPPLGLVVATVVGGTLSAGSASALNCVYDRDIDEQMRRTRRRALPRHIVSPRAALGLRRRARRALDRGARLSGSTRSRPGWRCWPSAFYLFGYTMLLKRRTTQNIVWGGLAGCFPALIGWTAVTGELAWPPVVLFLVVFFWTPPHTWALALRYREDYAGVDVPMLPGRRTGRRGRPPDRALRWVMVATSLLLWPVAGTGWLYPVAAAVLGAGLPRRGRTGCGARPSGTEDLARDPADAAVPLLEPLPVAAVRRRRAGPADHPLTLGGGEPGTGGGEPGTGAVSLAPSATSWRCLAHRCQW